MKFENAKLYFQTDQNEQEFKGVEFVNDICADTAKAFKEIGISIKSAIDAFKDFSTTARLSGSVDGVADLLKSELVSHEATTSITFNMLMPKQIRKHKKKRINKKWAKRYGYAWIYTPIETRDIKYVGRNGDVITMEGKLK